MVKRLGFVADDKKLMEEWDFDANVSLDPKGLTKSSNKKAFWKCKYCGHQWQTAIYHRAVNNHSCPKCRYKSRQNVSQNLAITHPEIVKEWHPTKNGSLIPDMFKAGSRYKVWWKCNKCGFEWESTIKNRVNRLVGCKKCKQKSIVGKKDLFTKNPELIPEWNYSKNIGIDPKLVSYASNKFAWWKCSKCGHEWKAKIGNRSILHRGCPYCAGHIVIAGKNDLATTHPDLVQEWHPTKNGSITPQNVSYGCGKKVWWVCPLGHEYQATISHRTNGGTNCPICNSGRQTSFAEQAVYFYIKQFFPDAISRYTASWLGRMELDIFIPSINYAIEYDGEAWHKQEKIKREQLKYKRCHEQHITLIRCREKMAPLGSDISDYLFMGNYPIYEPKNLNLFIMELLSFFRSRFAYKIIDVNVNRDRFKILKYKIASEKNSFLDEYPEIAKEWHPTKNEGLTPNMFRAGSDHVVWWRCSKCGYEWQSSIGHRTTKKQPTGCPECGKRKSALAKARAVNMIDPATYKIVKTFESITDAAKKTGQKTTSNIAMVCKGIRPKAMGYIWRYTDDTDWQSKEKQLKLNFE